MGAHLFCVPCLPPRARSMSLCRTLEEGAGAMCEGSYTRPKLEAPSADIGQQDALAGRPHGGLRGRAATGLPARRARSATALPSRTWPRSTEWTGFAVASPVL